jgi:hypothetical protein
MPLIENVNVPLVEEEITGATHVAPGTVTTGVETTGGTTTTGGVTTGGVTTGGVTTGGVTTAGGVTTGVVGAAPPLLVVAMDVIKALDSGEVSVGSALKVVVSVVRLDVCEVVATLSLTTSAKFFTALTNVAAVVGSAPLLALESAAIALTLSRMEAVGAACAKAAM